MNISSMRVSKIDNKGTSLYGVADITLENMIAIHDIKIIKHKNGMLLAMPSKQTKSKTFKDIAHPINPKMREIFEKLIFAAYEKVEKSGCDRIHFVLKEEYSKMNLFDLSIECFEAADSFFYENEPVLEAASKDAR